MTQPPLALVVAHVLSSDEIRNWLMRKRLLDLVRDMGEKADLLRATGEKPEAAIADLLQSIGERVTSILEACAADRSAMTAYAHARIEMELADTAVPSGAP